MADGCVRSLSHPQRQSHIDKILRAEKLDELQVLDLRRRRLDRRAYGRIATLLHERRSRRADYANQIED